MNWVRQIRGSGWARIGAAGTAYAALAVFLWPPDLQEGLSSLDVGKLVAALGAGAAWLWLELQQIVPALSAHDRQLHARIREAVTEDRLRFLREHDMGVTFPADRVEILIEIAHTWKGARFEFTSPGLQQLWANATTKMVELSRLMGQSLSSSDRDTGLWVMDARIDRDYDRLERERVELNTVATSLAEALDALDRAIQPRLTS